MRVYSQSGTDKPAYCYDSLANEDRETIGQQRFLTAAIIHEIGHLLIYLYANHRKLTSKGHSFNVSDYMCSWIDLKKLHIQQTCVPESQQGFADQQLWRTDPNSWYTNPIFHGSFTAKDWIGPPQVERAFAKKKEALAKRGIKTGEPLTGTVSPIAELGSSFIAPQEPVYYQVYTNALLEEFPGGIVRAIWGKDARIFPKGGGSVAPVEDLDFDLVETLAMQLATDPIYLVKSDKGVTCLALDMHNHHLGQRGPVGFTYGLGNQGNGAQRDACIRLLDDYKREHPGIERGVLPARG